MEQEQSVMEVLTAERVIAAYEATGRTPVPYNVGTQDGSESCAAGVCYWESGVMVHPEYCTYPEPEEIAEALGILGINGGRSEVVEFMYGFDRALANPGMAPSPHDTPELRHGYAVGHAVRAWKARKRAEQFAVYHDKAGKESA